LEAKVTVRDMILMMRRRIVEVDVKAYEGSQADAASQGLPDHQRFADDGIILTAEYGGLSQFEEFARFTKGGDACVQ
jgi:hypothetical protein